MASDGDPHQACPGARVLVALEHAHAGAHHGASSPCSPHRYALWSLSNIAESVASWRSGDAEAIVTAGVIQSLIRSLVEGRLSEVAQEHAARVLSGLVPLGTNAQVRS